MSEVPPDLRVYLVDLAVQIGKNLRIKLDFSDGSIAQVENILRMTAKQYKKTADAAGLNGIALEMAAYIITVIEKTGPVGRWERDHPEMGEDTFPYYWNEAVLFPYAWCQKRIFDGEQDDVWAKYKTLVIDRRNKS